LIPLLLYRQVLARCHAPSKPHNNIMSERMIELQRAKLGLPPIGQPGSSAPTVAALGEASAAQSRATPVPLVRQTSQQVAAATLLTEDEQLKKFLKRLQTRDDSNPNAKLGPTVPSALSRRMLQRQGVGYLDDTVAAITSAAADRFLATVLQQAIACRDRRLKGSELMREEARQRRKHRMEYIEDADERKRRKLAKDESRKKTNLESVAAAREVNSGSKSAAATAAAVASAELDSSKAKKPKKKKSETENGGTTLDDDDESSDDSLDEEEEYYQNYFIGEDDAEYEDEDDEELDTTLVLRDLERPLEAWDFKLTGKLGLGLVPIEKEEKTRQEEQAMLDDGEHDENGVHPVENGHGSEMPPSPSAIKTPIASPNTKGCMKSPPASTQKSTGSRAATPAPVASPNTKPAPT